MCAGKNRPLDEDELEFVNEIVERERLRDQQVAADDSEQMKAFREVYLLVITDARSRQACCMR